ncbi:hypothetical protein [Saccharothrix australiensis]|uniref:Uncharacterized protein n=1 Tax=Saccharothrix australiensis TaxID=2072 RepID=A0A495W2A6_9PSEU|nr:hypothetical protein [Saccharothrix australiensis]RKT55821.1 hypothetical protein C8E97_4508 [Saccharothrix australiensis]
MTASYDEVRRWDAEALEDAAEVIRSRKDQLIGLQDELDGAFGPLLWHGGSATAARGALAAVKDRAEHLVAEAGSVQRALYEAADAVSALIRLVEDTESTARANRFGIDAAGAVRDEAPDDPDAEGRARVAAELADGVRRVLDEAREIDRGLTAALAKAEAAQVSDGGATGLAAADPSARTADGGFRVGPPEEPHVRFDEDFSYGSAESTAADHLSKVEWLAKLRGAQALGQLPDATRMYEHYWGNTGEPRGFDYEKAYREDSGIRAGVDAEITRAAHAAEELIRSGRTDFPMTGQPSTAEPYPRTENWQKAVGGYQVWSHGDVRVDGNRVTMTVTVEAEDRYNFNRGQHDIATEVGDDENGRFTEVGWAKPFDTHGSLTRTVSWELGHPPEGVPGQDVDARGRERERGSTPDNPRERR